MLSAIGRKHSTRGVESLGGTGSHSLTIGHETVGIQLHFAETAVGGDHLHVVSSMKVMNFTGSLPSVETLHERSSLSKSRRTFEPSFSDVTV